MDFGIIERLAVDLPLSKVRRPQWDIDTVREMGGSIEVISTRTDGDVVRNFVVLVTKEASS